MAGRVDFGDLPNQRFTSFGGQTLRAKPDHQHFGRSVRGRPIGMGHLAVEIGAIARPKAQRLIMLGVDFQRAAQDMDELFADMLHQPVAHTGGRGVNAVQKGRHPLVAEISAQRPHFISLGASEIDVLRPGHGNACRGLDLCRVDPANQRGKWQCKGIRQLEEVGKGG